MRAVQTVCAPATRIAALPVWLLTFTILLTACGPGTRPATAPDEDAAARAHMAAGEFELAAQEYLRLAELYPNSAARHRLGAAEARAAAGDAAPAREILATLPAPRRQGPESWRRQLLEAELALLERRADETLRLTGQLPASLPAELRMRRHGLRARAFDALGDASGAAAERVALLAAGPGDAPRAAVARALWSGLSGLDDVTLQQMIASGNAGLASWAELAQLAGQLRNQREELEQAIAEWIAAHPEHPAVPGITSEILTAARLITGAREHVALLLPAGGQFARAAAAVRDGFLLQMYLQGGAHLRVTVLDTSTDNVLERYAEAVAAGARFVVGPLEKDAVAKLMTVRTEIPTLALNQAASDPVSADAAPRGEPDLMLFSFSLAPEDEALDAARRARADGHRRALVIAPDNEWGRRLAAAFGAEWEGMGGTVLEQLHYDPDRADYAALTRELFNLDSSQFRAAQLRQDLGIPVHGGGRKRRDADMIFMPATPAAARQVMPHFRYFGADRVPVYATSAVYSGNPDPRLDQDIDGVRFPDIPWVTTPAGGVSLFHQILEREFGAAAGGLRRLYAFGADAYQIMTHLGDLAGRRGGTLAGETGEIFLARDGTFHRRLAWAEFRGGVPAALEPPAPR
jgi:hypothetical protein